MSLAAFGGVKLTGEALVAGQSEMEGFKIVEVRTSALM
jgi:hypothetical protein